MAITMHISFSYRINDHENCAEMLIEALGTTVIDSRDAKGRYEEQMGWLVAHSEFVTVAHSEK